MSRDNKLQYKARNEAFITAIAHEAGVEPLGGCVYYRVNERGDGAPVTSDRSVVTVYYRGSFIDGRVFDDAFERGYPEAFRPADLIEGFRLALRSMRAGDHWTVYIPWQQGYGKRRDGDIPAYSTLVFDIKLVGVA